MPDIGAGAFPIVFGDFGQGYRVFDRIGTSILRDDLTQRTKGKVRFHECGTAGRSTCLRGGD